jgi:hypothetical protein
MRYGRALAALIITLAGVAGAEPEPVQRYSADWVVTSQGLSQTWRVLVDGPRMRADLEAYQIVDLQLYACPQRAVVRHDLKQIGLVVPYKRVYEEFAYDPAVDLAGLDQREGVEKLGVESVGGESATKYRATQEGDTVLFWLATADGVLLKASSPRTPGYALDVRNLKRGPQAASAFELPEGFARVDRKGEAASDVANILLSSIVPSLGSLMQSGQVETLTAEERNGVLRECRAVELDLFNR